ncbi:T9SS type A sorting domain-containing protein [Crocinitomix catalasitica]|nr:T9SS type A sorting domain-containing protein [Crocinitomix catalasitica]
MNKRTKNTIRVCILNYLRAGSLCLFLISTLFLCNNIFAQPSLDTRFDLSPDNLDDSGGRMLIINDTIYTTGGTFIGSGLWSLVLFKSTLDGDPVDTNYFSQPGSQYISTGMEQIGDSIIVMGSVIGDTYGWDPFIAIFDTNLDSIYYQKYDTTKHITITTFTRTDDGGFMLFGTIQDSLGGPDWSDLYLLRLDVNFNKIWDKRIPLSLYGFSYTITKWGDNFLLSGHMWNPLFWDTDVLYLMKIDSIGNTLSVKIIPHTHEITTGYSCMYDEKIYLISVVSDSTNVIHGVHYRRPQLIVLDTSFNILKETPFGIRGPVNYSWLPHGIFVQNDRVYTYGYQNPVAFIASFDLEGNYLWKLNYVDTIVPSVQDVAQIIPYSDNEFFGIGYKEDWALGPDDRDHWLFRVDSLGCMTSGCNSYLTLSEKPLHQYLVFPNPNNGSFQLSGLQEGDRLIIVDLLGNEIASELIMNKVVLNKSYLLSSGTYLLTVISGNRTETLRVIVL